jgi:hypothetical protein
VEIIKGCESCDSSESQFTISRREKPSFVLGQFKWEFGGKKLTLETQTFVFFLSATYFLDKQTLRVNQ